jgi:hypothetical protein
MKKGVAAALVGCLVAVFVDREIVVVFRDAVHRFVVIQGVLIPCVAYANRTEEAKDVVLCVARKHAI